MTSAEGATNPGVRAAVEAFAADPSAERSMDVLRSCLHGVLLFDATGSEFVHEDGQIVAGSQIRIATAEGPDGGSALVAFTSQEQIGLMHEDASQVQSLVQPAAAVLEFAAAQDHQWLYLDPAGPTCALSRAEIDFALRVPRNDAVRDAVQAVTQGQDDATRAALVEAIRAPGELALAMVGDDLPDEGTTQEERAGEVLTGELPDGSTALMAFTSGPELIAHASGARIAVLPTEQVLQMVRTYGFGGLVLNPAGPWATVPAAALLGTPEEGSA